MGSRCDVCDRWSLLICSQSCCKNVQIRFPNEKLEQVQLQRLRNSKLSHGISKVRMTGTCHSPSARARHPFACSLRNNFSASHLNHHVDTTTFHLQRQASRPLGDVWLHSSQSPWEQSPQRSAKSELRTKGAASSHYESWHAAMTGC